MTGATMDGAATRHGRATLTPLRPKLRALLDASRKMNATFRSRVDIDDDDDDDNDNDENSSSLKSQLGRHRVRQDDARTLEKVFYSTADSFVDILRAKEREKRSLVREAHKTTSREMEKLKAENETLRNENSFLLDELKRFREENEAMKAMMDGFTDECAGSMELLADVMQDCIHVTAPRATLADSL